MDLREKILAADDLPTHAVECPEWNCTLYVRTMTGTERDGYEGDVMGRQGSGTASMRLDGLKAYLVVLTVVDEDGARVFEESDLDKVQQKSSKVINRLADVALSVNGLTADDVEELGKN